MRISGKPKTKVYTGRNTFGEYGIGTSWDPTPRVVPMKSRKEYENN